MKKYILLFSPVMAIVLLSCHSNSNTETGSEQVFKPNTQGVVSETPNTNTITNTADTVGLAAFKAAQKKEYEDSLKLVGINEQRVREGKRTLTTLPTGESNASSVQNTEETTVASNNSNTSSSSGATTHTTKKKKKGMSNGTKGALIGGGAGALTGALVTKHNRGVGALVGAAAGGGAGYLIGHAKDKKEANK